jgi:hypothetical protein
MIWIAVSFVAGFLLMAILERWRRREQRFRETLRPDLLRGIVRAHVIRAPGLRKVSRLERFKDRLRRRTA